MEEKRSNNEHKRGITSINEITVNIVICIIRGILIRYTLKLALD